MNKAPGQENVANLPDLFLNETMRLSLKDKMIGACLEDADGDEQDYEQNMKSLDLALSKEESFSRKIIEAFEKWESEGDVSVLWDIDYTIGAYRMGMKDQWRLRASIVPLLEFLHEHFPQIKNGIITSRTVDDTKENFKDPKALAAVAPYFDAEEIYTSAGGIEKLPAALKTELLDTLKKSIEHDTTQFNPILDKYAILKELKESGHNVKTIDDNDVAAIWDGVSVRKEIPSEPFTLKPNQ